MSYEFDEQFALQINFQFNEIICFSLLITEIEATEACQWLRAAGFPQYAQMYEGKEVVFVCRSLIMSFRSLHTFSSVRVDLQFPIDLSNVAKDHPFLENDPLQSLYRRLVALNRCATMRLDSSHKHGNVS